MNVTIEEFTISQPTIFRWCLLSSFNIFFSFLSYFLSVKLFCKYNLDLRGDHMFPGGWDEISTRFPPGICLDLYIFSFNFSL